MFIGLHKQGGKKPKLSVLDKLIIMLDYYREYRSMESIAFDYGVVKSTICDSINWVENILINYCLFISIFSHKIAKHMKRHFCLKITEFKLQFSQGNIKYE